MAVRGDMQLIVSICQQTRGKIVLLNEVMSAYRIHSNGMYMGLSYEEKMMYSVFSRIRASRIFPEYRDSYDLWLDRWLRNLIHSNASLTLVNQETEKKLEERSWIARIYNYIKYGIINIKLSLDN
jgi:hypothetical protein